MEGKQNQIKLLLFPALSFSLSLTMPKTRNSHFQIAETTTTCWLYNKKREKKGSMENMTKKKFNHFSLQGR
jgi:hypothetical protein